MEIKYQTIKEVLKVLKAYQKGCEHTGKNRAANLVQREGAKKLGNQIGSLISEIEEQEEDE